MNWDQTASGTLSPPLTSSHPLFGQQADGRQASVGPSDRISSPSVDTSSIPALCALRGEGGPFATPHPLCVRWPGSHKTWSHCAGEGPAVPCPAPWKHQEGCVWWGRGAVMGKSQTRAEHSSTVDKKIKSPCEPCGQSLHGEHPGWCPERFLVRAGMGGTAANKRAARGGWFICISDLVLEASWFLGWGTG